MHGVTVTVFSTENLKTQLTVFSSRVLKSLKNLKRRDGKDCVLNDWTWVE